MIAGTFVRSAAAAAALALALASVARADDEAARLAVLLGVGPASVMADVGAGDGALAAELAGVVGPQGRVYATELEESQLEEIRESAREAGRANVEAVQAGVATTGLPDACCDAILLRHVYHHLSEPAALDAALFRALRPGGRLVVIDFRPSWLLAAFRVKDAPASRGGHGIEPAMVLDELRQAGFEPVETLDPWQRKILGPDDFAVVVRRP